MSRETKRIKLENPEQAFAIELPKAFQLTKELFDKFLPNNKVEIVDEEITADGIHLCPIVMDASTIVSVKEVVGWSLYATKTLSSNNREYPDEEVFVEFGEYRCLSEAVAEFLTTVLKSNINCHLDKKSDEEYERSIAMWENEINVW